MAHKNKEIIKRTSDMTATEYNRLTTGEHEVRHKEPFKKRKRKRLGQKIYANK